MPKKTATRYPGVSVSDVKRKDGKAGTEKAYYVAFRKNGKRYFELAGYQSINGMTAARANAYRGNRLTGKIPDKACESLQESTLSDIWVMYQKTLSKSLRTDISNFKHLSIIQDKRPEDITRQDVEKIQCNNLSAQTNAHICRLLTRIVNYGVDHDMCQALSFRVKLPKLNNVKTETLTKEQLKKLLDCLEEEHDWAVVGVIKLALYTGMRKSEILGLKWQDIDFERGFISITNPKGGEDQTIPMNDIAKNLLESLPKTKHQYIFYGKNGNRRTDIARGIARLREKGAFPEGFRPMHGLRHVFASMLASSGKVDMYTLQKLLTHKNPQMTQRYAHLHDDALKRGSCVVDELFKGE